MTQYAAALSQHPIPVEAVGSVAAEVIEQLQGERPDLVLVFASGHHTGAFDDIIAGLRSLLEPDVIAGMTAIAVAGGGLEVEDGPALSVWAANWGGGRARAFHLRSEPTADGMRLSGWPDSLPASGTLLLLADPFSFPVGDLLEVIGAHFPDLVTIGGMASAANQAGGNRLGLDATVHRDGAVAIVLDPRVAVLPVVSQGCRPVGQPFTVTGAERNVVTEMGGQPAIERLQALANVPTERDLLRRGVHLGIVVDEHKVDFERGDFLVRNVLGVHKPTGGLAVGDQVGVGQTVQFHVRDADSAHEDLVRALTQVDVPVASALLFTCNGRGTHLFGRSNHDAGLTVDALGPVPVAGAFCAGEVGPVGGRAYLHGFTASIAAFART